MILAIDWNNLDVKKYSAMQLMNIRERSYFRYDPLNFHFLYLIFSGLLITLSIFFFGIHMHWWLMDGGTYPTRTLNGFLFILGGLFTIGCALIPFFLRLNKQAKKNWLEMEAIRKTIDNELNIR